MNDQETKLKFDPLAGVNPGLKPVYFVCLGAAIMFSVILGWSLGLLAGGGCFFLFSLVSVVVVRHDVESHARELQAQRMHEQKRQKGFSAPSPDMLTKGPQGGSAIKGWGEE